MNRLFLFWNIGKEVIEKQSLFDNIVERCSNHYSYTFGNSTLFSRENIHQMKNFYLSFPIFSSRLETLSWEQYQLFLKIQNKKERYFYFSLSLFFHSNYEETLEFLENQYFLRI